MGLVLAAFRLVYVAYLAAIGVFGLGNSSTAFLILQTKDLGVSLPATILIYAAVNLVAALASYPAGAVSDRIGRRSLLLMAMAVFLVTYLAFAAFRSIAIVGPAFVFYGVFQGVFRAVGKSLAADFSPADLKASGLGWYGTAVGLTGLVGSVVAGQLWDRVGHAAVFYYGAAFAVLGAGATLALVREPTRRLA